MAQGERPQRPGAEAGGAAARCAAATVGSRCNLRRRQFQGAVPPRRRAAARLALILGDDELARGVVARETFAAGGGSERMPAGGAASACCGASKTSAFEEIAWTIICRSRTMGTRQALAARVMASGSSAGIALGAAGLWRLELVAGPRENARLEASGSLRRADRRVLRATTRRARKTLIGELERDYAESPYVDQAHLLAARSRRGAERARQGRARVSRRHGQRAKDRSSRMVARLRLARVQLAQNKPDDALATLKVERAGRVRRRASTKCAAMCSSPRATRPAR